MNRVNFEKIAPGIGLLRTPFGQVWSGVYLVCGRQNLLIDSGAMMNSIRASSVSPEKVVISAGNDKVEYARVHNEGYSGPVTVPAHTRHTRHGDVNVRQHTRNVSIPQRQFLGDSKELNDMIHDRIEKFIESLEI